MKPLLIAATWIFTLSNCNEPQRQLKPNEISFMDNFNPVEVITIDSCEYLFGRWGYASVLTHKGNCKFCKQRNK